MKKINWINLIFSVLLSISINLKIIINSSVDYFVKNFHINIIFILQVIILSLIIYFILKYLFLLLDNIPLKKKELVITKKKTILIFLCVFIPSLIFLLSHYPAVYLNDTLFMLYTPIDGMSPTLYGMIMSITFFAFKALFNPSISVFILSLIQSIVVSIIITYVIVWFNKKYNNKILTIILICYYSLLPIVSNYNVALTKDSVFSILMLLFFVLIYEIVESKGEVLNNKKFIIKLIVVSILTVYVRSNGLYVIIPSLIILFIIYGLKNYKKQFFITLLSIIVLFSLQLIPMKIYKVKYYQMEKYSIPLQQVSYLVKYKPNSLNDKEYKVLSKFIKKPKETIERDCYLFTVDDIKYNKNFDSDKFNIYHKDFLSLWLRKMPSNISEYSKSFLLNDYDLWAIDKVYKKQSIIDRASIYGIQKDRQIHNEVILPKFIQNSLISFYKIFNNYINPAMCFIILMLCNTYALYKKKKEVLILSIPLIVLWVTLMISTPFSSALRYMAPYIYILPIILLITFQYKREVKHDKRRESKKQLSKQRKVSK